MNPSLIPQPLSALSDPGITPPRSNKSFPWSDDTSSAPLLSSQPNDAESNVPDLELYTDPNDSLLHRNHAGNMHSNLDPMFSFQDLHGLQDSLLMRPAGESQLYNDPFTNTHPFQSPYTLYPSQSGPYSPELRQPPRIHVDTTALSAPQTIRMPFEGVHTPYEQDSYSFPRRPSLTTPSSSSSLLPTTPDMSPTSLRASPYIQASPISPSSPSLTSRLEMQPGCDPHGRNRSGQVTLQTVVQLAAAWSSPNDWPLLPQKSYRPHTQSDRRRYVEEVELEAPIMFHVQNPQGCGISLRDALNSKFMRLIGRDDLMFVNRGPSVSIRLMWPGYAPWSRQIPTRDFRSPPGPITRSKLAKNVAKTVHRFINEVQNTAMEEDADPQWKVGRNHIALDDLILVGLQHVSMGSWQAHLRVRRHN